MLHDHPAAWRISNLAWALSGFLFVALLITPLRQIIDDVDAALHRLAIEGEWQPLVTGAEALDIIGSVWITFPFIAIVAIPFFSLVANHPPGTGLVPHH